MSVLENLQPENVFRYFEEISRIPRGSYHTKEISGYLADFAKKHGFWHCQDKDDNIIMIKEASAGYEDEEPVILQGHMDMVCEKEEGCKIDFENEGLSLYVDGGFLKAKGTTLGADDGIAIAYILAVFEDDSIAHPRLEAVITSNEEVGLLGAKSIDVSMLKGHILLNIDSDREGHFLTGCAGGLRARMKFAVSYEKARGRRILLRLCGLAGGHSGSEIGKERANAVIEMGRVLSYLAKKTKIGILSLEGGLKDNAIPREAEASLVILEENILEEETKHPEMVFQNVREIILQIEEVLKKEYAAADPGISICAELGEAGEFSVLDGDSMKHALFFLRTIPNGVVHMDANIDGLVETSLNAGIMKLTAKEFSLTSSVRSSVESRKEEMADRLAQLTEFLGGEIVFEGVYPAWEYRAESKIRDKITEIYRQMFQKEPVFEAIHAGLECGILAGKIKPLDAVSFGPDNFDIHTPKERLSIASVERVYRFLLKLLGSMKQGQ